ncbi:DUF4230 domain-containing protein [Butyrivibrio sp. AD3002]|uniref:DUF4230 domain-containing protein n=1 Tax=Butyrivibrio sp. AD3002 TaxID=1280670 RepID=UPI0003B36A18|nr:DUF4230 domain-containing protein [Butyrivibrio sp. AD3002]
MNFSEQTKKNIYLVVIGLSVIVMIILVCGYIRDKKSAPDEIQGETPIAQMKPQKDKVLVSISTETIQDGLSNMGILLTQEYYFTQVEKYTKEKKILSVLPTSSEFMYSYDGAVMAGIDFEKIEITKDEKEKKLTVHMPESEIQTVNVDKDTFKIYSEKDSLWNPLKLEDYNISLAEFENTAKQKALDSGILERSDEQAKNLVMNFIKNFPSASDYEIVFE